MSHEDGRGDTGDTTDAPEGDGDGAGVLVRQCEHCDWDAAAGSHAEMVRTYHDHLREEHPDIWLRT